MVSSKKITRFFFLLILPLSVPAQDSLLNPKQKHEIFQLNSIVGKPGLIDSATLFKKINTIQHLALREGNKAFFLDAELIKAFYYFMQNRKENTGKITSILEWVKQEATKNNLDYINARVEERYGQMYCWLQNYEKAFDHWQRQLAICYRLKNPDEGGIQGINQTLYHFADIYYYYGEYRNSISYLRQLLPRLKNNPDNVYYLLQGNNTLGICYQKLGMIDSADYYLKRCRDWAISYKRQDWEGIANDGLGTNLFLRGKYREAVPLLQQNVDLALQRQDWWSVCGSLLVLADIRLKEGHIKEAEALLKDARRYADAPMSLRAGKLPLLYPLLAKLYTAKGQYQLAAKYIDSTVLAKDSQTGQMAHAQLLRMNQRIDILKQKSALTEITNEKNAKLRERNLLVALVITLILLSACILFFQRKKHQQQQLMKEMLLSQQEKELLAATEQLQELARSIVQNNELSSSLHKQFTDGRDIEAISKLQKSYIHDWDRFKILFEKVHAGYLDKVDKKFPGISPSEMRFMTLAKLNFSNKEMASALGVSPEAMRVTWHRLRKKLNLPGTTTLAELVASIQ